MTGTRIYGAWGRCIWPAGAGPLADVELLALGTGLFICEDVQRPDTFSADLVVIAGDNGDIPAEALGHVVAALDRGHTVAVHAADAGVVAAAAAKINTMIGGGRA